jgi:hypothetical protein
MDDMTAFERRVASEVIRGMGRSQPVDDAAILATIAATRSPTRRFQAMFSATKFVVAAAIVALFVGFLLVGVLTEPSHDDMAPAADATTTPISTSFPPIQLPTDIPADVRSGTLETPFGPARWVHLTGDETSLPSEFAWLLSTPSGYVVPDIDSQTGGSKGLWRSPDLIRWTLAEPLGIQAGVNRIWRAGDMYWLSAEVVRDDAVSLWRSRDTRSWEQVTLEQLSAPEPDGYAWRIELYSQPATYDGVTLFPFTWSPDYWVVLRELPVDVGPRGPVLVQVAPGVFDVKEVERWSYPRSALSEETVVTLRMEETERGLRVTDDADGTDLAVLEGVSLEFIELLAEEEGSPMGNLPIDQVLGLAILEGEELLAVDLPQAAAGCCSLALTADESGFLSYAIGTDGLVHVHRSQDGRAWRETDIIGDDADEPTGVHTVGTWDGPVSTGSVVLSSETEEWRVSNGRLERAPAPPGNDGLRVASGWIVGPVSQSADRISFIPDEGARVSIDLSDTGIRFGECGSGGGLISANTMAIGLSCAGPREWWILTLDDLSASDSVTE